MSCLKISVDSTVFKNKIQAIKLRSNKYLLFLVYVTKHYRNKKKNQYCFF